MGVSNKNRGIWQIRNVHHELEEVIKSEIPVSSQSGELPLVANRHAEIARRGLINARLNEEESRIDPYMRDKFSTLDEAMKADPTEVATELHNSFKESAE